MTAIAVHIAANVPTSNAAAASTQPMTTASCIPADSTAASGNYIAATAATVTVTATAITTTIKTITTATADGCMDPNMVTMVTEGTSY